MWQPEQPIWGLVKSARPRELPVGAGFAAVFCPLSQRSNFERVITIVFERMIAWPMPQSSVHSTMYVPTRVGVMCSFVTMPGTTSCF